jgi:hypothetical protein
VTLPGRVGQVTQVASGYGHSLVVTSSGQLYAFGDNQYGQLGSATNSGTGNANPTPTFVTLPGRVGQVTQVAAGLGHSLVVTSSGQLYAFGYNQYGHLGSTTNNGTANPNPTPRLVSLGAGTTVASVARGPEALHSLVMVSPPPVLSRLGQAHAAWRAGIRGVRLTPAQRRVPIGTHFSFTLNTPATVRLAFARRLAGRLVRGRCVPGTRANRTRRSCIRTVSAGRIILDEATGPNSVAFAGRLGPARRLPPGNYTVTVTAFASQLTTAAQTLRFTIARG